MHCYYGDRGSLLHPRIEDCSSENDDVRRNAPALLASMDRVGAVGFEYHVRFRPELGGAEPMPPVIRLMRPGLVRF